MAIGRPTGGLYTRAPLLGFIGRPGGFAAIFFNTTGGVRYGLVFGWATLLGFRGTVGVFGLGFAVFWDSWQVLTWESGSMGFGGASGLNLGALSFFTTACSGYFGFGAVFALTVPARSFH